jgi:hypothetical protein
MADAYAFNEGEAAGGAGGGGKGVVGLCRRLATAKGKDTLLKALKALGSTLEALPQDMDALGRGAADELPGTLFRLASHSDKDVKLSAAVCIVNMLRIWAPATPYEDEPERLEVRKANVFFLLRALCFFVCARARASCVIRAAFLVGSSVYVQQSPFAECSVE